MSCHIKRSDGLPSLARCDRSGVSATVDHSPLTPQLEQQALRKLEALQRWMEATDIRPDMQRLLADAVEDLRDVAMRLVGETHSRQQFREEAAHPEVRAKLETSESVCPAPDPEDALFDEGPRAQPLRSPTQALTFHQNGELPQALWEEGITRSSAPLPVLVDEPESLNRRCPLAQSGQVPGTRHPYSDSSPRGRSFRHSAHILELAASESGQIEAARFVSIQGLEPGDVIGGPVDALEADEFLEVTAPGGWTSGPGLG